VEELAVVLVLAVKAGGGARAGAEPPIVSSLPLLRLVTDHTHKNPRHGEVKSRRGSHVAPVCVTFIKTADVAPAFLDGHSFTSWRRAPKYSYMYP
jgi:hypothetical protein